MDTINITWNFETNAHNFSSLSQYSWEIVDNTTGLISKIIVSKEWRIVWKNTWTQWLRDSKNSVRNQIWKWGEKQVKKLFPYSRNTPQDYVFDLRIKNTGIEVKTSKVWNASILKIPQIQTLNSLDLNMYYAFVFYDIKWWGKPSQLVSKKEKIESCLSKRHVFIFPISYIIFAINTLPQIHTIHTPFQKMSLKRTMELYSIAKQRWTWTEDEQWNYWVSN